MSETSLVISDREQSLKNVGHVSYALHTIVAVGAVIPSFQPSIALLLVAFIIDLVKKGYFPAGSKVLYAHLGGAPALNGYSYVYRNG